MSVFQLSCTNEGEECNEVYKEAHVYSLTPQVNYCCKVDFMSYGASSFLPLPFHCQKAVLYSKAKPWHHLGFFLSLLLLNCVCVFNLINIEELII